MRYTEKETENLNSLSDYCKRFLQLMFTSQFRLINEITRKLIFIKKEQLEKLWLTTVVIGLSCIMLQCIIGKILGSLNFFYKTLPIIFQIIIVILLLIGYFFFKNLNFEVYDYISNMIQNKQNNQKENHSVNIKKTQTSSEKVIHENKVNEDYIKDDIKPNADSHDSEEEPEIDLFDFGKDLNFTNEETIDFTTENSYESVEDFTFDESLFSGFEPLREELINKDVFEDEVINDYQNSNYKIVNDFEESSTLTFSDEELAEIDRALEKSVNDDRFFDDGTIDLIIQKFKADEALESSDMFNQFSVPASFKMVI